MTKAQEILKSDIEKIKDETVIEKVRIFILGILVQQNIDKQTQKQQACTEIENFFKNDDL